MITLLLSFLLWSGLTQLWNQRTWRDDRLAVYRLTGEWLHENTPPEARIGTLEVGIIGYYADRPLVDFAGLLQPAVAARIQPDTTYDLLALWATQYYRPEYLVVQAGTLPALEAAPIVQTACREIQILSHPTSPRKMVIYSCEW